MGASRGSAMLDPDPLDSLDLDTAKSLGEEMITEFVKWRASKSKTKQLEYYAPEDFVFILKSMFAYERECLTNPSPLTPTDDSFTLRILRLPPSQQHEVLARYIEGLAEGIRTVAASQPDPPLPSQP